MRKYVVAIALLLVAAAGLWWWLGREKVLLDLLPAKCKAVVRLSSQVYAASGAEALFRDLVGLPAAEPAGEDLYLFITPNEYFGAAMTLADAAAFDAALTTSVAHSRESGIDWYWTQQGWLAARRGTTLLVAGPATVAERDRLRHTLSVMFDAPASEGFGHSPEAQALTAAGPMAFVASASVLPAPVGTLLRLGLPETAQRISGHAASQGQALTIEGGIVGQAHQSIPRTENRASCLLQAALNVDGGELLRCLRSDDMLRMMLTALSDTTSAAEKIRRMHATSTLLVTAVDTAGNATFRLSGTDAEGRNVVLSSTPPAADVEPLKMPLTARTYVLVNLTTLLASPLPESLRQVFQHLFGNYRQAEFTTTAAGDFCFTLTP